MAVKHRKNIAFCVEFFSCQEICFSQHFPVSLQVIFIFVNQQHIPPRWLKTKILVDRTTLLNNVSLEQRRAQCTFYFLNYPLTPSLACLLTD